MRIHKMSPTCVIVLPTIGSDGGADGGAKGDLATE